MKNILFLTVALMILVVAVLYFVSVRLGSKIFFECKKDRGGFSVIRRPKTNPDGAVDLYVRSSILEHIYAFIFGVLVSRLYGARISNVVLTKITNPSMEPLVVFVVEVLVIGAVYVGLYILGMEIKKHTAMAMAERLTNNGYKVDIIIGANLTERMELEP